MSRRRKAWGLLKMLGDTVTLEHTDPCQGEVVRDTVYNPYKKQYVKRGPTLRRTKEQELQLTLAEKEEPSDVLWIGDKMEEVRQEGVMRVWHQNWNGVEKYDEEIMKYQLSLLIDNNINYFSIVETRINQNHKQSMEKWRGAKESIIPNGEIKFTSTPDFPNDTPNQPGGLLSGYHGALRSRYRTQQVDKMGRWHYHQFQGEVRDLRIYTLYRVNNGRKETQGDTTAWTQQHMFLDDRGDKRNPRIAVIEDFLQEIEQAVKEKYSIIIMADLNEDVDSGEGTNKKLEDIGLNNLMKEYIGAQALPRTCLKGPRTIDHIWVTGNILNAIHSAGYAPFDFTKNSDHRGLYFDFHYKDILDSDVTTVEPYNRKRLKSTIPTRVEAYMKKINESWKYHKIEDRFMKIRDDLEQWGKTDELETQLNTLDTQITEIMMNAEKLCSKVPASTTYAWSVKMKEAVTKFIRSTTERTKARKMKIGMAFGEAINIFKQRDSEWKEAKKEYLETKKNDKQERKTHLDDCAIKNAERKGTTFENEIKQLKHIEQQREQGLRLKSVMKPFGKNGVTTILIPAVTEYSLEKRSMKGFDHHDINTMWDRILPKNGQDILHWERITDKVVVEDMLLAWQRKHFTQANETPLASVSWNDQLRQRSVQEDILNGQFSVDETMHSTIQDIFLQMRRPTCIENEITFESTYEDFVSFVKGASEKISTSPSGRGYNHYKTMLMENGEHILRIIHAIVELARKHGIILQRWKKTYTTLMEKKHGDPKIHRMRALHIIEAEVQFLAKLFYCKKLLRNAEHYDLITNQQYGGRNNKQTQMAVINKLMYYNISHQQVMDAAFVDDDARNCYDRIITALSAVEMRTWGHSYEEAEFSIEFLQSQEYHVRTQLGITKKTYTYDREEQTHGSGQGIAWAGVKFTKTSDTISKAMESNCAGMYFHDPENKIEVKRNGDIFVDDTALGVTANTCSETDVLKQLEQDQQYHAFLLFATGHKLALDKCHYYWVSFERHGTEHRHKLIEEMPGTLSIKEGFDKAPEPLKRYQPFQSHKTLGCHISVTNNQKGQIRALESKINNWCQRMKTRYLSDEDSQYAYHGYLRASLQYIVGTTSMTKRDCEKLAKKFETILLHSYNLQRNCSRTMMYMPKRFGGLGIKHIYHLQGQEKYKFFAMHMRRNDVTGKLFNISLLWSQLEAGTSAPFYTHVYSSIRALLTKTWITNLIDYFTECQVELHLTDSFKKKLARANDFYLMDIVRKAPISEENKQIFNQIRLFLKVELASDIVEVNKGSDLCRNISHGRKSRISHKAWPNIHDYPTKWLEIWNSILSSFIVPCLQNKPLGIWIQKSHQMTTCTMNSQKCIVLFDGTYYAQNRDGTYTRTDNEYDCHEQCEVISDIQNVVAAVIQIENASDQPNPEKWIQRNWGTFQYNQEIGETLYDNLQKNNLIGFSDGSVLDGVMAHAFCFAKRDTSEVICSGTAPVDFPKSFATSYRAESCGALALLTLLDVVIGDKNIQDVTVPICIDNMETVKTMQRNMAHTMSTVMRDNQDIYIELRSRTCQSKVKIEPEHVKGHMNETQDEITDKQALNQLMDWSVGSFIRNMPPRLLATTTPPIFQHQKVVLVKDNVPILSHLSDALITGDMEDNIVSYFKTHHNMEQWEKEAVDFDTVHQVLEKNQSKLGQRVKSINHQWNTMSVCKRWKTSSTARCPLCNAMEETWQHVYCCTCPDISRVHNANFLKMRKRMETLQTLPHLQHTIEKIVQAWRQGDEPIYDDQPNNPYNDEIKYAFNIQKEIGFSGMMNGFLAHEWGDVQNKYYRQEIREKTLNITRWRQNVVSFLLQNGIDLWNERCTILHSEKQATADVRYRKMMKQLHAYMKENRQYIHQSDAYLLNKSEKFFTSCDRTNVEMWHRRLNSAVERQKNRKSLCNHDIREYGNVTQRPQQQYRKRAKVQKKRMKQQTLFAHKYSKTNHNSSTPISPNTGRDDHPASLATNARDPTFAARKRRIEEMILRRTQKVRKVQTKLTKIFVRTKRPVLPDAPSNTTSTIVSSIHQFMEPLRKRLRKSSNDPKNNR